MKIVEVGGQGKGRGNTFNLSLKQNWVRVGVVEAGTRFLTVEELQA